MKAFIEKAKAFCKLYKESEFVISGINRTNYKQRVYRIIDEILGKYIPEDMRQDFSDIKQELAGLLKLSKMMYRNLKKNS